MQHMGFWVIQPNEKNTIISCAIHILITRNNTVSKHHSAKKMNSKKKNKPCVKPKKNNRRKNALTENEQKQINVAQKMHEGKESTC